MRRPLLVLVLSLAAGLVEAGPERVNLPRDYQSLFIFDTANNAAAKTIRIMYVNPETFKFRQPGKPLPDGTILVAEERPAKLDADGKPLTDRKGRYVPAA